MRKGCNESCGSRTQPELQLIKNLTKFYLLGSGRIIPVASLQPKRRMISGEKVRRATKAFLL
jgi:hypothetical protein